MKKQTFAVLLVMAVCSAFTLLHCSRDLTIDSKGAGSGSESGGPGDPGGQTDNPGAEAGGPYAFPGAMGVGKHTPGGRGGRVIKVTQLGNSGAGSLREALLATGPRIVTFAVSGNIDLTSELTVTEPFVTIAGQSSPGGISVSGKQFSIATHDVIIRHMRFRSGGHRYTGVDSDGDSLSLIGPKWNGGKPAYNIIVDHCSVTWGTDETFSITGGVTKTTVQNSLIAQGLRYAKLGTTDHSKGLMISGKYGYDTEISLYRNYIAHNTDRNPLMYNPEADGTTFLVDATNNVSYNWKGGLRPTAGGDARVSWIANYMKEGPYSNRQDFLMGGEVMVTPAERLLYLFGNLGNARTASGPEWLVSVSYTATPLSDEYQRASRWEITDPLPYETMTPTLASQIVAASGATVPLRDSVDAPIVSSFDSGVSLLKDTVTYPGDWPTYDTSKDNPVDADSDGMPDQWESAAFGDLTKAADGDVDGDGYTNIEEYLNQLADDGS